MQISLQDKHRRFIIRVLKLFLLLVFFLLIKATQVNAQAFSAEISEDLHLQILPGSNATYTYLIDHSQSDLPIEELAETLKIYNSEHSTVLYYEDTNEFKLHVEMRAKPNWTIEDWNSYLSTMAPE